MKGFIFGIVTMILILALGLLFALKPFVNMRANNPPSKIQATLGGHAMDASIARAGPKATNPLTADESEPGRRSSSPS
jgi:hypothetical protein